MGNNCASTQHEDIELVLEEEHSTLGFICVVRPLRTGPQTRVKMGQQGSLYEPRDGELIGVKQVYPGSLKQMNLYLRAVKQSSAYSKIPTLLRVLTFETSTSRAGSQVGSLARSPSRLGCGESPSVSIFFPYHQQTLAQVLQNKRNLLSERTSQPWPAIRLNQYEQIDRLPHTQRCLLNIYYQEVEILRMLDHIVGALYFLNHLEHKHEAVCPQNILMDEEGKFILVDAAVFGVQTNYHRALATHLNKAVEVGGQGWLRAIVQSRGRDRWCYLSPELLAQVKNKSTEHRESPEKAEVFSLGLVALQMCLLGDRAYTDNQELFDEPNLRINKTELYKMLLRVRERYSDQLVELLACMLEYEPAKRTSFGALIDMLSPVLTHHMERVQQMYRLSTLPPDSQLQSTSQLDSSATGPGYTHQLMHRLSELEHTYQRIVNNSTMFRGRAGVEAARQDAHRPVNEDFIIQDERRILHELKKLESSIKVRHLAGRKEQAGITGADKREVKGSELYDIYLSEYQQIKQNRIR